VFFGLLFGPVLTADRQRDPRLPVGWVNQNPGGLLSGSLESLVNGSDVIRPIQLDGERAGRAAELVDNGDLAAVVRVPAGYSQAVIADQPVSLEMIADQTTPAGRTAVTAVDTVTGRLLGTVESAHISVATYEREVGFKDDAARQVVFQEAFQRALAAWNTPPLTIHIEQGASKPTEGSQGMTINGFTQSSAGMIVQFSVFGLINSAMLLVLERKTRCLQRLLTTPIRRAEVIGGHVLAMFLVVFAQETILVILGQVAFGVEYLRQPLAILLMMVVLAFWAACLGLLIGALAKKEDQVIVLCLVAMFLFSAMGGAWFPLDVAGRTFSAIGHVLPSAWAMDGFQNIILRGLGFSSVLLPAGIVLAYALAFFGLALWRFKFE
jgi:ABC-2 type transport system permease protein